MWTVMHKNLFDRIISFILEFQLQIKIEIYYYQRFILDY